MDAVFNRITNLFDWVAGLADRPSHRVFGLLLALPTTTVLAIATWLTPSPDGFGTHKQLGLGGCAMLTMTGWPCPMCGMTTTFSLMAHVRPLEALINQPFGVVLFTLTAVVAFMGITDAVTGRGLIRKALKWIGRREQILALGLLAGMIGGWIYKCVRMHPDLLG